MVLGKAMKVYNSMEKGLKLKFTKWWGKLVGALFVLSPPPILSRVKNELIDSRPVKTMKRRSIGFITSLPAVWK